VSVDPNQTAFLAAAATRAEEALAGLTQLAEAAVGLPQAWAAALGVLGLLLLAAGARRRRLIGALGGAAVGALLGLAAGAWMGARWPGLPRGALPWAAATALAALGGLAPSLFVFAAGALPGAVLGAAVPIADRPELGLVVGALVLGSLALVAAEFVAVAVASSLGAALLGGALLALASPGLARELAARPAVGLAWVVVVGAAGMAFQLGRSFGTSGGGRGAAPTGRLSPPDRPEDRSARSPGSPA
jgi:hypothetical protein